MMKQQSSWFDFVSQIPVFLSLSTCLVHVSQSVSQSVSEHAAVAIRYCSGIRCARNKYRYLVVVKLAAGAVNTQGQWFKENLLIACLPIAALWLKAAVG
jgi:hypothetical protein